MTDEINYFVNEYRFLSNFYPVDIVLDGITYPSVEHLYQAMKSTDRNFHITVANTANAGGARWLGRKVKPVRLGWTTLRDQIMIYAQRRKFGPENPELVQKLIATGDAYLREGNTWNDKYWGVVEDQQVDWIGQNKCGINLMQIRHDVKHGIYR